MSSDDTTRPARRGAYERLQATERWLRTNPRQVSLLVVVLVVTVPFFQQSVGSLWLVFTYSLSVALAGYGLGLRGGVVTALVATLLLYRHAIDTLAQTDTLFVVATRLAGNLLLTSLTALAAATVRAREEYLVSRNRLAQLQDDLVAAFAHDVRSPLAAILGHASMLREETETGHVPPDLVATLRRIEANATHAEDMIAGMLNAEHSQAAPDYNEVSCFPPEALVEQLRDEFDPIARSQRRGVSWQVMPGTPDLATDRRKLLSVLRNLIGNALKYATDAAITVQIRFDSATATHVFEVGDDGPGIPRQALPRLFDRFYRIGSTRDRDGFGLGLFIVKRMTEMLGGEVSVQSEVGHGTRFRVVVPRLDAVDPHLTHAAEA